MRETARNSFLVAIVLGSLTGGISQDSSYCYPDYCQSMADLVPTPGFQCSITPVQIGEECEKLNFDDVRKSSRGQNAPATFTLRAYTKTNLKGVDNSQKATAFNLSISDINFHGLITRYRNIVTNESACRHIELYGNESHPVPRDLFLSCAFSDAAYEGSAYSLEYLAIGKNIMYSKKYIFYVPEHEFIDDGFPIETYTPFVYIDVSEPSSVALYIQPLPSTYNVAKYKVWLINNDTASAIVITACVNHDGNVLNFTGPNGIYYVEVAALHPDCGSRGCANSTSPYIKIKHASHPLLIMIISLIWIPPIVLYALYNVFKLYRKRVLKRMAMRPNCLLVYSPTHPSHVNVMAELTKYLQYCNINAMIDIFEIAETVSKDPGLWCNTAFQTADVVLVVTSPPMSAQSDATIVYRNVDNHLLRLLKENYPRRNKRYYAIHLPYCKPDHIPEEARVFKKFRVPEDLIRLVKTIHGITWVRFITSSNQALLESIRFATVEISQEEASIATRNTEETDDLLPPIVVQETANCDAERPVEVRRPATPDSDVIPQSFTTRIDELNLLGETGEEKSFVINSSRNDCEFRIDKLNL